MSSPSRMTVVLRSLAYFRRSHSAVGLGVAVATAVIVGALLVGDSVRNSLRRLVLERLANLEMLLVAHQFVERQTLLNVDPAVVNPHLALAPIVLLSNCSAESKPTLASDQLSTQTAAAVQPTAEQRTTTTLRASRVQLLAIDDRFLELLDAEDRSEFARPPAEDEIYVNASLSRELNVGVGDLITLRLSQTGGVPADNPLGRRDQTSVGLPRQKIIGIISDQSIGGLRLQASQEATLNVFASLSGVQSLLKVGTQVNAALVFSTHPSDHPRPMDVEYADRISDQLRPKLEDLGLQLRRHRRQFPDAARGESSAGPITTLFDYYQLSHKQLIISDQLTRAIIQAVGENQCSPSSAYLANVIGKIEPDSEQEDQYFRNQSLYETSWTRRQRPVGRIEPQPLLPIVSRPVPYSIVMGLPYEGEWNLDQYRAPEIGRMRSVGCWVNSWLAEQLEVKPGDWIQLQFYEPETVDGDLKQSQARLMVAGIVPLTEPDKPYARNRPAAFSTPPTRFNDPDLTPTVDGITDQESIANWDVPFELEYRGLIQPADDRYWENHRLTPKVILPHSVAERLFRSRFGSTTAISIPAGRFPDQAQLVRTIEDGLLEVRQDCGLVFRPIRNEQLRSASGTTPFDALFLSLSSFVIASAVMLIALLFRLGIQQRTSQLGLFLSQGYQPRQLGRMILLEMAIVIGLGCGLGIALGIGYARLILAALTSWWIGAISVNFLEFSFRPTSLWIGTVVGGIVSLLAIAGTTRTMMRIHPLRLLRGDAGQTASVRSESIKPTAWFMAVVCLLAGLLLPTMATNQPGMVRAGYFLGSGVLLLVAGLLFFRQWLSRYANSTPAARPTLLSLAVRTIARNPLRSWLSVGLLAVASFLILSISIFQVSPHQAGSGGFDLIGMSTQPIYENLGSPAARNETIGPAAEPLLGSTILPLRMREGDDASCTNLFQVNQPTILGLSQKLQKLSDLTSQFRFSWAATSQPDSPWTVLQSPASGSQDSPIPVILDQNTAQWSLKQGGNLGAPIELEIEGKRIHMRVVGLLSNSILQGKLIISERNFELLFPKVNGYRFFLVRSSDPSRSQRVAAALESGWSDAGMDVTTSQEVLRRLLGVQNTYISAFQSLGALGLLLGTFGLIAVQIRSVVERRRELAVLQAIGFSNSRIGGLLTLETSILLGAGLLLGGVCSAMAVVPYVIGHETQLSTLSPLLMLLAVLACGFATATIAVRRALQWPVLESLRSE
ncbi:MAG: ABC transporter permease [Pirellulaceae bacterium]|nr:ABC transporter permease [Pirellulaceae bacterium]